MIVLKNIKCETTARNNQLNNNNTKDIATQRRANTHTRIGNDRDPK